MSVAYLFRAAKARTDGPCNFPDHRTRDESLIKRGLSSDCREITLQESCHWCDDEQLLSFAGRTDDTGK
jgi:hypothetical protein